MNSFDHMERISAQQEIARLRAELAAARERAERLAVENNELKIELAKWVNYWRDKDKALSERDAALAALKVAREALEEFTDELNACMALDAIDAVLGENK